MSCVPILEASKEGVPSGTPGPRRTVVVQTLVAGLLFGVAVSACMDRPDLATSGWRCSVDSDCQEGGICSAGVCYPPEDTACDELHDPACDDGRSCTTDYCELTMGRCIHVPIPSMCMIGDECGCAALNDAERCVMGFCDPDGGCFEGPSPEGMVCSAGASSCGGDVFEGLMCDGREPKDGGGCNLSGSCSAALPDSDISPLCLEGTGCAPFPLKSELESRQWASLHWDVKDDVRPSFAHVFFRDDGIVESSVMVGPETKELRYGNYSIGEDGRLVVTDTGERDFNVLVDPTATYGTAKDAGFYLTTRTALWLRTHAEIPKRAFTGRWHGVLVLTGAQVDAGLTELVLGMDDKGRLLKGHRQAVGRADKVIERYEPISGAVVTDDGWWLMLVEQEGGGIQLHGVMGARGQVMMGYVSHAGVRAGMFILVRDGVHALTSLPSESVVVGQGPAVATDHISLSYTFWADVIGTNVTQTTMGQSTLCETNSAELAPIGTTNNSTLTWTRAQWGERFHGWLTSGSMQAPVSPLVILAPLEAKNPLDVVMSDRAPSVMIWRPRMEMSTCEEDEEEPSEPESEPAE